MFRLTEEYTNNPHFRAARAGGANLEGVLHIRESIEDCTSLWRPRDGSCSKWQWADPFSEAPNAAVMDVSQKRFVVRVPVLIDGKNAPEGTPVSWSRLPSCNLQVHSWEAVILNPRTSDRMCLIRRRSNRKKPEKQQKEKTVARVYSVQSSAVSYSLATELHLVRYTACTQVVTGAKWCSNNECFQHNFLLNSLFMCCGL
jgi:hypothetical protein